MRILSRACLGSLTALAAVAVFLAPAGAADEKRPNFILIFADDQGYQDLGCFGSPDIKTPNLDRLAAEGMRLTSFYSSAQVCSPSRSSLMTGCYSDRVSVPRVLFPRDNVGLHPNEITVAEVLKTRDYATACVGKWHLGHLPPFLPTKQGFDSYFGIPYSNDMSITRDGKKGPPLLRGEEIVEHPAQQNTLTKRYTAEAVAFIEKNKDRPFFLYLPHTMPHVPLFASDAFRGKSARGLYGDVIEEIDWSVGQLVKTLKQHKLDRDTLILYTSDNGPWLIMGKNGGSALPLRDGKGTLYEGGLREPCIAWWPGRIPAGKVCDEVAATIDVLPTFAKLAGAKVLDDRIIDGRDIWPLLSGQAGAKSPHEAYFYRNRGVRSGPWKLLLTGGGAAAKPKAKTDAAKSDAQPKPKAKAQPAAKPKPAAVELYNLAEDISEQNNVADKHPEIVARLRKLLDDHNNDIARNKRPEGTVEAEMIDGEARMPKE